MVAARYAEARRRARELSPSVRYLLTIDREGEKHVSGRAACGWISGVHEYHSAADCRTGSVDRSPTSRCAVDRLIRADGIEVPDDLAVCRRVGTDMAVDRS